MKTQRTLKQDIKLQGIGLHTGRKTSITIKPAKAGAGIQFVRADDKSSSYQTSEYVSQRRSVVKCQNGMIETVEHLTASIAALGVTCALIEVEGPEIPAMDGSAYPFARAIEEAGVVDLDSDQEVLEVRYPLWVHDGFSAIIAMPYDGFRITYTVDYNHPMLSGQTVSFDISKDIFMNEISRARTFCLEDEAQKLRQMGFGKGADYSNTLVIGKDGPIDNELRYPDECARHKVLDIIGDFGLGGFGIRAHLIGIRSGHQLNGKLLKLMKNERNKKYDSVRSR